MFIFSKELLMASEDLHGFYEWTTPGTYYFTLKQRVKARIAIVGGGGHSLNIMGYGAYAGAGGSAFVGKAYLNAGTYTVVVGANHDDGSNNYVNVDSTLTINDVQLINAETANVLQQREVKVSRSLEVVYGSVEVEAGGNQPTNNYTVGGASLYNGWGKGADVNMNNCTNGYFSIEW